MRQWLERVSRRACSWRIYSEWRATEASSATSSFMRNSPRAGTARPVIGRTPDVMNNARAAVLGLIACCIAQAGSASPLVVHEWGTFTSFQDANGATIVGI